MPDYLGQRLALLGATATIIPLGMPATTWNGQAIGENTAQTTVTSAHGGSGVNAVFTYQPGARPTWAKQMYTRGRGKIPFLPFNGTTENLTAPDADYWTAIEPAALSVISWVSFVSGSSRVIFSKYSNTAATQELVFYKTAADKLSILLVDASAAVGVSRLSDSVIPLNSLTHWAFTYDGAGGATAANTIKLYVNGALVASTATNNASYVAMENQTSIPNIGAYDGVASFLSSLMASGALGPTVVKAELTAAQIAADYAIGIQALKNRPYLVKQLSRGTL